MLEISRGKKDKSIIKRKQRYKLINKVKMRYGEDSDFEDFEPGSSNPHSGLNFGNLNNYKHISLTYLYTFTSGFWLLLLLHGLGFAMFPTWTGIGIGYMQTKYKISHKDANFYLVCALPNDFLIRYTYLFCFFRLYYMQFLV